MGRPEYYGLTAAHNPYLGIDYNSHPEMFNTSYLKLKPTNPVNNCYTGIKKEEELTNPLTAPLVLTWELFGQAQYQVCADYTEAARLYNKYAGTVSGLKLARTQVLGLLEVNQLAKKEQEEKAEKEQRVKDETEYHRLKEKLFPETKINQTVISNSLWGKQDSNEPLASVVDNPHKSASRI